MRPYQSTATQVNLAGFSTDVNLSSLDETEVGQNGSELSIPPSIFTAISCSTQTAFSDVRVGPESRNSTRSDCLMPSESSPVEEKAKTLDGCEKAMQYLEAECGADSSVSAFKEASDRPALPRSYLQTLDEDQREESHELELTRLEGEAQCSSDIQKNMEKIVLEENETPDAETTSLDAEDFYESHSPTTSIDMNDVQTVFQNLVESLSILEEDFRENMFEEADMSISSSVSRTFTLVEAEQADIKQENESSPKIQELEEEDVSGEV